MYRKNTKFVLRHSGRNRFRFSWLTVLSFCFRGSHLCPFLSILQGWRKCPQSFPPYSYSYDVHLYQDYSTTVFTGYSVLVPLLTVLFLSRVCLCFRTGLSWCLGWVFCGTRTGLQQKAQSYCPAATPSGSPVSEQQAEPRPGWPVPGWTSWVPWAPGGPVNWRCWRSRWRVQGWG